MCDFPKDCLPLEEMDIYIDEPERIRIFTSSWRVETGPQYTNSSGIGAWETNVTDAIMDTRLDPLTTELQDIFKRIWPNTFDGGNTLVSRTGEPPRRRGGSPWSGRRGSSRRYAQLPRTHNKEEITNNSLDLDWWSKWSSFPLVED
jgi:hypothetical protein